MLIINMRRLLAAEWAQQNPILGKGEPGYEDDTGKFKVGNGLSPWNELGYFVSGGGLPGNNYSDAALQAHINSSLPHPVYDDGPSLDILYKNAKV